MKLSFLASSLTLAALLGFAPAAHAQFVAEVEPNDSFAAAQDVSGLFTLDANPNIGTGSGAGFVNTSTVIPHITITSGPGQPFSGDYYSFTTGSSGNIILDIDSDPQVANFDTRLFLFDAAQTQLLDADDEGDDPGDIPNVFVGGAGNSRIETGVLPAGNYFVFVREFGNSGVPADGTYTLNISANGSLAAVPEPGSVALLVGMASVSGMILRRRRK